MPDWSWLPCGLVTKHALPRIARSEKVAAVCDEASSFLEGSSGAALATVLPAFPLHRWHLVHRPMRSCITTSAAGRKSCHHSAWPTSMHAAWVLASADHLLFCCWHAGWRQQQPEHQQGGSTRGACCRRSRSSALEVQATIRTCDLSPHLPRGQCILGVRKHSRAISKHKTVLHARCFATHQVHVVLVFELQSDR